MSYIEIHQLCFSYDDGAEELFENVNLQIDGSWKLGLIGRNGRGKTTFLNLLLGQYDYRGSIQSDLDFVYFPYSVSDPTKLTIEILQGISPESEDWELLRETSLLDLDAECLYRPFETLSNGEQTKALLAAMFSGEHRFLLLDEPTNHVDAEGRQKIGNYLEKKHGFILVSHDRSLLDRCIDHVLSINRTDIEMQQGNFSTWWENFCRREQSERTENEKLKKEAARLSKAARQSEQWSEQIEKSKKGTTNSGSRLDKGFVGHKSAKMMQKAKNFEKRMQAAAREKTKLLNNVEEAEPLQMVPLSYPKRILISGKDISLYYQDAQVCSGINFEVFRGDRMALSGQNGCGKSTLLKLICGEDIQYTGTLERGSSMKISYVPQTASFLHGTIRSFAEEHQLQLNLLMTNLHKLGFEREQFDHRMESMSEGQKKKILIAGSLCQCAHLYIWDEPLNYIDVLSRVQLENLILQYQPTLIFVEHDRIFCDKIATKKLEM